MIDQNNKWKIVIINVNNREPTDYEPRSEVLLTKFVKLLGRELINLKNNSTEQNTSLRRTHNYLLPLSSAFNWSKFVVTINMNMKM